MLAVDRNASLLVNRARGAQWTAVNLGHSICLAANITVRSKRPSDDGAQQSVIPPSIGPEPKETFMASRTKPLISAAALASAAAIAVATPALSPNLGVPTPAALSEAAFELTTLEDVLSVPTVVWTDLLFGNDSWGGTLGPDTYGPDWAAPEDAFLQPSYKNPWVTFCDNGCDQSGIQGVTYLFLDALINGNGNGFEDSANWPIGIVNYFAEPGDYFPIGGGGNSPQFQYENLGYSAATWYVLQGTLGQAVPELTLPIASLFWGPQNLSVFYNLGLSAVAGLLNAVPLVGPITGNSILAYLGDLPLDPENPSLGFYQYGLSGVLNYWIDIADGSVPFPGSSTTPAPEAATLAASPAVAEVETAKVIAVEVDESAPALDAPTSDPVADAPVRTPVVEAPVAEVADAPVVEAEPSAPVVVDDAAVEAEEIAPEDAAPADVPEAPVDVDVDVADIDLADLEDADTAPAETPKGVVSGGVKDATEQSTSSAGTATAGGADAGDSAGASDSAGDSAGAADSSGAGDSAGSDKSDSDSDN
jgi:hypothetical protein